MITLEWDVPFILSSPYGDLDLNSLASIGTTPLGYYVLDPAACKAGTARRVTRTNIAQAGGEITHKKYRSGYSMELTLQLWETIGDAGIPAQRETLVAMGDHLMLHLNGLDNEDGRIRWTPSGFPERMLDRVRMLGPSIDGAGNAVSVVATKDAAAPLTTITFALLSPFPYAMDYSETSTHIADGATTTLDNTGNSDFYPVFKVHGPTTFFTITNYSVLDETGSPLAIQYNDGLPGAVPITGGHYAEINTFRNTVYKDGDGANLKPGIDILFSDFFALAPGDNDIEIVGANMEVLWQSAYA